MSQTQLVKPSKTTFVHQPVSSSETTTLGPSNHKLVRFKKDTLQKMYDNYKASKHLNRAIDQGWVSKYKKEMEDGRWIEKLDLAPVLIDANGCLRGGQHRVVAFLDSKLTEITFPCIWPATEEEISRQDVIKQRNQVGSNQMSMKKSTYDNIISLEFLSERTLHSAANVLLLLDNHPGLKKSKTQFKDSKSKQTFNNYTPEERVSVIEKYLNIFREIDDATPIKPSRGNNFLAFAPFVAAFAKAHNKMDKTLWKKMARFLTIQDLNTIDKMNSNLYLAADALISVFNSKSQANNPVKVDKDARLVLSCLAAAHLDVDIKTIDMDTFGYDTFVK